MTRRSSVYVARDGDGHVLYVGLTSAGRDRMKSHGAGSGWWGLAETIQLEHFATRAEAAQRERELIASLKPRWNKAMAAPPELPDGRLSAGEVARLLPWGTSERWVKKNAALLGGASEKVDGRVVWVFTREGVYRWLGGAA